MIGISVKNFSIAFGQTQILKDISFEVNAGEIVTILGPSGCGKSTILRAIASLQDEYEGEILLNETCKIDKFGGCNKDIGYIFQDYALFPHLNVLENIEFALYKLDVLERQKRVDVLLKQFDLTEHRHKQIHELSGGQQQRVSIARVIAYEPKVLLLDEPFANLDTLLRNKTKIWLKKIIKDLGLSAILVTHDQKEALSMSDKIAIIHDKKIEQFGTPSELYNKPNSLYIANFLNRINSIPSSVLEKLNIKVSDENVGIISIENTNLTSCETMFKASVQDISFCGDFYEVEVRLKDFDNCTFLAKMKTLDALKDNNACYLDLDSKYIKVVRKS